MKLLVLKEVAAHFRHEEHHGGEEHQEDDHRMSLTCSTDGTGMPSTNASFDQRFAFGPSLIFNHHPGCGATSHAARSGCATTRPSNTSGNARSRGKQKKRFSVASQWRSRHESDGQIGPDERDRREDVDDHLGAPERHLAPGNR